MKRLKIILMIVLFYITTNVFAIDNCTNDEMKRLRELANNVKITYDYTLNEKKQIDGEYLIFPRYKAIINNLDDDLKIYYRVNDSNADLENIDEITNDYVIQEGRKLNFYIYSYTNNLCTDELLKTINVTLPYYNYYYYENKTKCQEYPDFKYCKEFMEVDLDFDKIDKEFDQYIKSLEPNDNINNLNIKWYYFILPVLVILIILVIILKKKKRDDL